MSSHIIAADRADTRKTAIAQLVEQDVQRWGESEREAQRADSRHSLGLALNELANRAERAGRPDMTLRDAANAALTTTDWRALCR